MRLSHSSNKDIGYSLMITLFLFGLTKLFFGFYWGWVDDIIFMNELEGIFFETNTNISQTKYFIGISNLFIVLFKSIPSINWYGLLLYGLAFTTIFLFVHLSFKKLRKHVDSIPLVLLFITTFFLVFFVDFLNRIDFTTVTLFSFGIIVFFLTENHKSKKSLILLIPAILALLTRSNVLIILVTFLIPLLFVSNSHQKKIIGFSIGIIFAFTAIVEMKGSSEDLAGLEKYNNLYFYNVLDGNNAKSYDEMELIDYPRSLAFFTWFSGDHETLLNDEYLNSLESYSPFSKEIFKNIERKLDIAYDQTYNRYTDEYTLGRNWLLKGVIGLGMLLFLSYIYEKRRKTKLEYAFIFLLASGVTLFPIFLAIFYKIEFRIVYPILTLSIFAVFYKTKFSKRELTVITSVLLILAIVRFAEYRNISKDLKLEFSQKDQFKKEVNTKFSDKLIVFDYFTFSLNNPGKIIKNKYNQSDNQFIIYGDYIYNFSAKHRAYLVQTCESSDIIAFHKCLYDKKEDVIFALSDYRVMMYEAYFKDVYNEVIRFKKLEKKQNALNSIEYTFSWDKRIMDYYVFDHSFEDAETINLE